MMRSTQGALLTCLGISLTSLGCGAIVDTAYKLGNGKYQESSTQNRATEHKETAVEYEVSADLAFQCFTRTRPIERSASVTKTFEYRGGFDKVTYGATAGMDGVMGALIAGSFLGICTNENRDTSCLNMLWASPFAIDLVYSLVRSQMVRPAVLVDKTRSQDSLVYGAVPTEEHSNNCDDVASVWLGTTSGPSRESRLNSGGGTLTMKAGAIAIPLEMVPEGGARKIQLTGEVAGRWADSRWLSLFAEDTGGVISEVIVDRCTVLRPLAGNFTGTTRSSFDQSCPLPSPNGSTTSQ